MKNFQERLNALMQEKKLTQTMLALRVDTTQGTVNRWLHGSIPRGRMAKRLCVVLGVHHGWLFDGEGPKDLITHKGGGDMPVFQGMSPGELGQEIKRLYEMRDPKAPYLLDHVIARLVFAEAESKP